MNKNLKKGFTLIELLVVIAIIGILSSVVLVSLNSARQKARDAQRKSNAQALVSAIALYSDAFANPAPVAALTRNLQTDVTPGCGVAGDGWTVAAIDSIGCPIALRPSTIPTLPIDTAQTDTYAYKNPETTGADAAKFCLVVKMENTDSLNNNSFFCNSSGCALANTTFTSGAITTCTES